LPPLEAASGIWQWGVDGSLPGTTPANPVLPVGQISSGAFDIPVVSQTITPGPIYIDPAIATGYDYTSTNLNFASVVIPQALPGGDSQFQLNFQGHSVTLNAGTTFDFTSVVPGGVSEFTITGINPAENLDPNNPGAFVTGLTFVGQGGTDALMTPLTQDVGVAPEPASLTLLGTGAVALLGYGWRRRRQAASAKVMA
jgi:hypothetical protein